MCSYPGYIHKTHCWSKYWRQNISFQWRDHLRQDHQRQHHHCGSQVSGHPGWEDHQQQHRVWCVNRLLSFVPNLHSSLKLLLCFRYDDEDHHHPHDVQAERDRGAENYGQRSDHPRAAGQKCGHDASERWGESNRTEPQSSLINSNSLCLSLRTPEKIFLNLLLFNFMEAGMFF